MITTRRELYIPAPSPGVAQWVEGQGYADAGLTREEIWKTSNGSDAYFNWKRRLSRDNGKTWSEPVDIDGVTAETPGGGVVTFPGRPQRDETLGIEYRVVMQRVWPGRKLYTFGAKHTHPLVDHTFIQENGGPMRLLRYEDGPEFDPANPWAPEFLAHNGGYFGQRVALAPDGTAFHPMRLSRLRGPTPRDKGVVLMRRDPGSGAWTPSDVQYVSEETSSRGLLEPDAAVLKNGHVLVVCRGSSTPATPGQKWMSVSTDGGKTLGTIEPLRYDDGSILHSPSSIHRFIRSTRNGRLYWMANILGGPDDGGNGPRYPLCIAEIDEVKVAVRRDSVEVIDTRQPGEPERVQFSNFYILEDRKTQNIEIYITLLGLNPTDFWRSDVYRYVFSPPK
jgi:hypothetical protein